MPVVVDNSEATCSRGSNVLVGLRTQFRDKRKNTSVFSPNLSRKLGMKCKIAEEDLCFTFCF
jgi:hypothetical protein